MQNVDRLFCVRLKDLRSLAALRTHLQPYRPIGLLDDQRDQIRHVTYAALTLLALTRELRGFCASGPPLAMPTTLRS